jgi:hypothetical protein
MCWSFAVASACALGALACGSGSEAPLAPAGAVQQSPSSSSAAVPGEVPGPVDESTSGSNGAESGASPPDVAGKTSGAPESAGVEGIATNNGGMITHSPGADAGSAAGGSETPAGTSSTFHVFLLLGQSNMAGYPKARAEDRTEDPRVLVLGFDTCAATGRQPDVWDIAAPPLHECFNDGLGPGDYFAKTLVNVIPAGDTIGLVPCAISGERIETFSKVGGTRYDYIVQRARRAQEQGGIIEGLLFHQGESNNGDPSWPAKVNALVTDLRADLGLGNAPFLAGELLYSGGAAGHNRLVNQLPSVVSNAFVVSADGLLEDPADTQWHLHFDRDSEVEFGKRYAAQMIAALGW